MTKPVSKASSGEHDPYIGQIVGGKYRILGTIASGGMGTIYRSVQLPLERPVALKILHPGYTRTTDDLTFQKRFLLEASILSRLSHPHIVTVYDYGRIDDGPEGGAYYMAMELLLGDTLHQRLKARGPMPPREALDVMRQMARGVREAHRNGVIHRDLKPANVMLLSRGQGSDDDAGDLVKVLDFGLVKVLADDSEELTMDGTFLGSPRYMAPEQIACGKVDARTDVYSLGVILFQMLCGKTPFEGENNVHILMSHLHDPVPRMRERAPEAEVPPVLEAFVRRLLEKKQEGRPASIDELLSEMRACEETLGLASGITLSSSIPGPPRLPSSLRVLPIEDDHPTASFPGVAVVASRDAPQSGASIPVLGAPPAPGAALSTATSAKGAKWPLVVGVVAVAAVACGGIWAASRDHAVASPLPAPSASAQAQVGSRKISVSIASSPEGATVLDGDVVVGKTPMSVSFDNDALRSSPHRLTLTLSGYQSYTFLQGPMDSGDRASVSVPLLPAPQLPSQVLPEAKRDGAGPEPTKGTTPGRTGGSGKTTKGGDPDISLAR